MQKTSLFFRLKPTESLRLKTNEELTSAHSIQCNYLLLS